MSPVVPSDVPYRVALVLLPGFPLMTLSNIVEPLRAANTLLRKTLFEWQFLSLDGESVRSSCGVSVNCDGKLGDRVSAQALFVCAGLLVSAQERKCFQQGIRQYVYQDRILAGVSSGVLLLADAGFLNGYCCTVHWEYIDAFTEKFQRINVVDQLFVNDRKRITCAGGTATMDMMLDFIAQEHGQKLSSEIGHWFIHENPRQAKEHQHKIEEARLARQSIRMAEAIKLMRRNIEEPVPLRGLAEHVNVSLRQLERLFRKYQKTTIQKYYLALRLDFAQRYVTQSELPILNISVAVGFRSQSHFIKCYREKFCVTPTIHRKLHSMGADSRL